MDIEYQLDRAVAKFKHASNLLESLDQIAALLPDEESKTAIEVIRIKLNKEISGYSKTIKNLQEDLLEYAELLCCCDL
jgi:hypothetical protein